MKNFNSQDLPASYRHQVVTPTRIEHHIDTSAYASKTLGFDHHGVRCYYRHAFTITEERFDSEEFPVEIGVYQETVLAWRLNDGKWLKVKESADQLEHCQKRVFLHPPEITDESQLAR